MTGGRSVELSLLSNWSKEPAIEIRRTSDRAYLECFECGRETRGWTTGRSHQSDRAANGRVHREPVNKRDDHSAPAVVRSSRRRSLRFDGSIGDHRDITIARSGRERRFQWRTCNTEPEGL